MNKQERSWPKSPELSVENLPQIVSIHQIVVIHFWALWNGYDKIMDANLQKVKEKYQDKMAFYAINADLESNPDVEEVCLRYSILNLPALACFIRGRWQETSIGTLTAENLEQKLHQWSVNALEVT